LQNRKRMRALAAEGKIEAAVIDAVSSLLQLPADRAPAAALDSSARAAEQADEDRIERIVDTYSALPDRMPEDFLASLEGVNRRAEGEEGKQSTTEGSKSALPLMPLHPGSAASLGWLGQFFSLSHRSYLTQRRSLSHLRARFFTNVFLALF